LVRRHAAEALGKIGERRAVAGLILCLKDEESVVRGYAAEALGKIGERRAVVPLIACLKDENWWVRRRAARALSYIGDRRAIQPLEELLQTEKQEYVIKAAEEAVKNLKGKQTSSGMIILDTTLDAVADPD